MIRGRLAVAKMALDPFAMSTRPKLPVADPKPPDCGPENTGWLKALKNSARKSIEVASVIFVLFVMDRSQVCWNGPRNVLRPTFPMAAPADAGFGAPLIWQGTRTFWLFTQLPPRVTAFRLRKEPRRLSTPPEGIADASVAPGARVAKLNPLIPSRSWSVKVEPSKTVIGDPDWKMVTPLTAHPFTNLLGPRPWNSLAIGKS